jgi:hypothetical protein
MMTLKEIVETHGLPIQVRILNFPPFDVIQEYDEEHYRCKGNEQVGYFVLPKNRTADYEFVGKLEHAQ